MLEEKLDDVQKALSDAGYKPDFGDATDDKLPKVVYRAASPEVIEQTIGIVDIAQVEVIYETSKGSVFAENIEKLRRTLVPVGLRGYTIAEPVRGDSDAKGILYSAVFTCGN